MDEVSLESECNLGKQVLIESYGFSTLDTISSATVFPNAGPEEIRGILPNINQGKDVLVACVQNENCLTLLEELRESDHYFKAIVMPRCAMDGAWERVTK
jgi:hypothetical protein